MGVSISSICFLSDERLLNEKWKSGCAPKDKLFCENLTKTLLLSRPQLPPQPEQGSPILWVGGWRGDQVPLCRSHPPHLPKVLGLRGGFML